jgi:hypothetical protein
MYNILTCYLLLKVGIYKASVRLGSGQQIMPYLQ